MKNANFHGFTSYFVLARKCILFSIKLISFSDNFVKSSEIFSIKADNLSDIEVLSISPDDTFNALHISENIIMFGTLFPISGVENWFTLGDTNI